MGSFTQYVSLFLALLCFTSGANAWIPTQDKIRGVNLGGLFVVEAWMMGSEWSRMGCGAYNDEYQCVQGLGQQAADAAFQKHWNSWIVEADMYKIKSYGLNTIRIPLGFWMREDLVQAGEYFPRGGLAYLGKVCQYAKNAGLYIILDLHAAPGAQSPDQQFTGRAVHDVQFFTDANYERAYKFLEWMTKIVHSDARYANVWAIEVVNEPVPPNNAALQSLLSQYYPTAWARIQKVETNLSISKSKRLHIQMMDARWYGNNGRDPSQYLTGVDKSFALYDDHKYLVWDNSVPATRRDYMYHSCYGDVGGISPVIVGEWSLGTRNGDSYEFRLSRSDSISWYEEWFAAQIKSYEKQRGWTFWNYKVELSSTDMRWGYKQAVEAGAIPSTSPYPWDADYPNVCAPYGA